MLWKAGIESEVPVVLARVVAGAISMPQFFDVEKIFMQAICTAI